MSIAKDPILNSVFLFLANIETDIDRAKSLSKNGRHRECRLTLSTLQRKIYDFNPGETAPKHQTGGLPAGDKE